MGKITLIEDNEKTYQGEYGVIITKVSDYVNGYNSILNAIYENQELVVIVRNKHCMNWLRKMQIQYNENRIVCITYSPKIKFQDMIGVSIPDYISDTDIANDELILKVGEFVFSKNLSFEDNILNHYLGMHFTHDQVPFHKLYELFMNIDFELMSSMKEYKVLSKVYKSKLKQWDMNCVNEFQKDILAEFRTDPKELYNKLSKYSVLNGYPMKLQTEVIGDMVKAFNKLNLKVNTFILDNVDIAELKNNIRLFLNSKNLINLNLSDLEENISMLSGHLSEEVVFVQRLVEQNKSVVNKSVMDKIRKKFDGAKVFDSNFEEYISNLMPPSYVLEPVGIDNIKDWINWALSSYLPYKFWMEETSTVDSNIDKFSEQYAEWVFNNYDSLISSEPQMIYKTIKTISSNLKNDSISLIVMIDNFNYKYVNYCKELFLQSGYSLTQNTPTLSMLPTATEVSKYAFFSGDPFSNFDKQYSAMCKQWETMLEKPVRYLPDLNSLECIHEKDANLYILNYLSLDKVLHDNAKDSAIPLKQRIKSELYAMVDKIMAFTYRLGVENLIKIYIISDHGSTKIIEGQDNLIPPKFYKDKSEDAGYRYIKLDDNKFNTYKDSLGNLCYPMDKAEFGVKYNYMIAKSYNRFLKNNEETYVHGGISPEEHIIPLLKFEKVDVILNKPNIALKTNVFRFNTLANFVLEIKNFNEYQISNLTIFVLNDNIKLNCNEYSLGDVESYKLKEYVISNARIINNKEVNQYLKLQLNYEFVGKKYSEIIELELNIKSTQQNSMNLDDLF